MYRCAVLQAIRVPSRMDAEMMRLGREKSQKTIAKERRCYDQFQKYYRAKKDEEMRSLSRNTFAQVFKRQRSGSRLDLVDYEKARWGLALSGPRARECGACSIMYAGIT